MKRKNYIFTNKKHPKKAIMGTALGVISWAALIAVILLAYRDGGQTRTSYGVTGFLAAVYSLVGAVLGLSSFQSQEKFRVFPILSVALNLTALLGVAFLLYMGGSAPPG